MDVSIIIPVYNEEKNIPILHNQICSVMNRMNREYEIIYINDGSNDNSFEILQRIQSDDAKIKLINFYKNYGQTSALYAGLHQAKGEYILTMDADLQNDANDLIRILEELHKNDVVIGNRINRKACDGFIKFISSKIANFVRNKVLKEDFKDVGSPLRGYRRGCLKDLISMKYEEFYVFTISLLNMAGYQIKEIPVKTYRRKYGKSNYNIRNRLFKTLIALLVVKWLQNNRLRYKII